MLVVLVLMGIKLSDSRGGSLLSSVLGREWVSGVGGRRLIVRRGSWVSSVGVSALRIRVGVLGGA